MSDSLSSLSDILAYVNKIRIDDLEAQQDSFQAQLNSIINLNNLIYDESSTDDSADSYWAGDVSDLVINGGSF